MERKQSEALHFARSQTYNELQQDRMPSAEKAAYSNVMLVDLKVSAAEVKERENTLDVSSD